MCADNQQETRRGHDGAQQIVLVVDREVVQAPRICAGSFPSCSVSPFAAHFHTRRYPFLSIFTSISSASRESQDAHARATLSVHVHGFAESKLLCDVYGIDDA